MGMSSSQLDNVLIFSTSELNKIDPESNAGLRALYFIRIYKKLYGKVSGDEEEMKLWMNGENKGTGGIPAQQVQEEDIAGLVRVMKYLEALP